VEKGVESCSAKKKTKKKHFLLHSPAKKKITNAGEWRREWRVMQRSMLSGAAAQLRCRSAFPSPLTLLHLLFFFYIFFFYSSALPSPLTLLHLYCFFYI
jgi:hypothetical protein